MTDKERRNQSERPDNEFFIGGWDPYVVELTRPQREDGSKPRPEPADRAETGNAG